jgi:hypothetical protein
VVTTSDGTVESADVLAQIGTFAQGGSTQFTADVQADGDELPRVGRVAIAGGAVGGSFQPFHYLWVDYAGRWLRSTEFRGVVESGLSANHKDLSNGFESGDDFAASTGRWVAVRASTPGRVLLWDAFRGASPTALDLANVTGRFVWVHLGDERYLLGYPSGGEITLRSFHCAADCLADNAIDTRVPLAEKLLYPTAVGLTDGTAFAWAERFGGALEEAGGAVKITFFDVAGKEVATFPMFSADSGYYWDVRVARTRHENRTDIVVGGLLRAAPGEEDRLFLGGLQIPSGCGLQ